MIANGIWIFVNGGPILLSSFPVLSLDDIKVAEAAGQFWGRVLFGIPSLAGGAGSMFWLIFAFAMLLSAIAIYLKPRRQKTLGLPIAVFSLLTIPIGGGFIIGSILGLIAGVSAMEYPTAFGDTLVGKIVRAVRLDSSLFGKAANDATQMRTAAIVIILASFLSGLGNSLYTYNLNKIKNVPTDASSILLRGALLWDNLTILTAIGYVGIALLKWLALSLTLYIVGAKLAGYESDFDKTARAVAFAYVPVALQIFLPLMFSNEPGLSFNWPIGIFLLTNFWMIFALAVATKEAFAMPVSRALGTVALGGAAYWLINYMVVTPALAIPGVGITFKMPESSNMLLVLLTLAGLLATLLGVFKKR